MSPPGIGRRSGELALRASQLADRASSSTEVHLGGGWDHAPISRIAGGPTAIATPPTPFPVSHGRTTASLSLGPLGPGDFSCPSGQLRFLDSVSYSNTVVSDATGNSTDATPDPISATLHIQF